MPPMLPRPSAAAFEDAQVSSRRSGGFGTLLPIMLALAVNEKSMG